MTAPRVIERVVATKFFVVPPVAGDVFTSASGRSALSLIRVRRMVGSRTGTSYRLFATRIRLCDLPASVTPLPWPRKVLAPSVPTSEGFIGPPPPPPHIHPPAAVRIAERKRIVTLLRDDRDEQRPVPKIRIQNQTALTGDWVDPDDIKPTSRREAKRISGYRSRDAIETLLDNGTIGKGHGRAARRFRRDYELGEIGLRASRSLNETPTGYASGTGPSESRMAHLEAYQATVRALLPHMVEVVLAIVIREETLLDYATRKRMNRQAVAGYVLASLDVLSDHYKNLDDDRRKEREMLPSLAQPPPA